MDVGYARFYGADDDAAASCDDEEGARLPERRTGWQGPDTDRVGRADRVASRSRAGGITVGVDAHGGEAQGGGGCRPMGRR